MFREILGILAKDRITSLYAPYFILFFNGS